MLGLRKVAVTGGLASGKSTVCNFFKSLGAYVVDADEIVHQLLSPETPLGKKLVDLLGPDVINNGEFDRKRIAEKVFRNEQLLHKIEELLHPAVYEEMKQHYLRLAQAPKASLFVAEVPLLFESPLFESGEHSWFDSVIYVDAPFQDCLARYEERGGEKEDFKRRSARFLLAKEKSKSSNYIIYNDKDLGALQFQVSQIFHALTQEESRPR